jgi:hypothetical protein
MSDEARPANEQDIFSHIFGSGFDTYPWWVGVTLIFGGLEADYFAPRDGWVVLVEAEDPEDEDKTVTKQVRAANVKTACHKIMRDKTFRKSLRDECAHLLFDEWELDMDAVDADVVMQYIMFDGEIVYG